jgi:hypothetical protein
MTPAEADMFLAPIRDWIDAADCRATPYPDGSVEISDGGGEIRYVIREESGSFSITREERRDDASVLAGALSQDDALRLVVSLLGPNIRLRRGLPWLRFPVTTDALPDGYSVEFSEGGDRLMLNGTVVGRFGRGDEAYSEAARFAHLHDRDLEEIKRLFAGAEASSAGNA